MMLAARFSSLRWRLTLLILALLAVTGSAFAWTAYREMERALRLQGSARIRAAAGQLADLLGQAGTNRVAEARRLTADASIRRFAAGDDAPGGALAALRAFIERNPTAAISLNAGGAGDAVHILEKNITIVRTATPAASVAAGDELGPLRVENGHLTYSVRVGVPAPQEGAAPLPATLTIDRPLASSAAAIALIKQLLGNDAAIKVGNVAGDVWTDLSVPVAAPRALRGPRATRPRARTSR